MRNASTLTMTHGLIALNMSTLDERIATLMTATGWTVGEIASIAQVVFNPSSSARRHARLAAEFRQVMANARRSGEYWTPSQCDEFEARVAELEASEPAPMSAVVLECENRAALRAGKPPIVALPRLIRLVQHWWNFNPSVLMKNYGSSK